MRETTKATVITGVIRRRASGPALPVETAPTIPLSALQIVDDLVRSLGERVTRLPPGADKREMAAEQRRYERVTWPWKTKPPTDAQRAAVLERLLELEARVVGALKAARCSNRVARSARDGDAE